MVADDDLLKAVLSHRDGQLAELAVLVIGIAAETHPEILKVALEKVFDFKEIERRAAQANERAKAANEAAESLCIETRELVQSVHETLAVVERRFDKLGKKFKELDRRATKLETP